MVGIALCLHFGSFQLLSCGWRRAGVRARPLMNKPLVSESLGEFWGRRWNTAFRDLTHRFLFRPLTRRIGVRAGLAGGFVFSGLVHDLVISWPAAGGYGGPTLFFAIQGVGMLIERSAFGHHVGLGRGVRGWLFSMLTIVLPAPLLFHGPFVERIVVPFMRAMGAL
jgi:alginate O-acetyltransferase complex protein AlgI